MGMALGRELQSPGMETPAPHPQELAVAQGDRSKLMN